MMTTFLFDMETPLPPKVEPAPLPRSVKAGCFAFVFFIIPSLVKWVEWIVALWRHFNP